MMRMEQGDAEGEAGSEKQKRKQKREWTVEHEALEKYAWVLAGALFLDGLLAQGGAYLFGLGRQMNMALNSETAIELYGIVVSLIPYLLPYIIYARIVGTSSREITPPGRPKLSTALAAIGICMGISLAAQMAGNLVLNALGRAGIYLPGAAKMLENPLALVLDSIALVVISPIVEEVVCRGIILGSLRRFGSGFAILISTLLFSLSHGNIEQVPYAFIMGLALGYFVVRLDCLWLGIIIHSLNNLAVLVQNLVTGYYGMEAGFLAFLSRVILSVLFFGAGIFVLYKNDFQWRIKPVRLEISQMQALLCFLAAPPMIAVLLALGVKIYMSL